MRVVLTARAESQLAELPPPAVAKVVRALRLLQTAPRSGQAYPDDSPFGDSHHKAVVVRARRWAYRITYTLDDDTIWIRYLYPSWYPLTHPGLARRGED